MGAESPFVILLTVYSHGVGLVIQLAHQALQLNRIAKSRGIRVHVASIQKEQNPGLWNLLRTELEPDQLIVLENDTESLRQVAASLHQRHRKLVIHVQGNRQLLSIASLRRQHPDSIRVVYTVHSFRHRTWMRTPQSWYTGRLLRQHVDFTLFCSPQARYQFVGSEHLLSGGRGGMMVQGIEGWDAESAAPFAAELLTDEFRRELEASANIRFLYLTREVLLHGGKGQIWMITAAAPVLRRHPNARLIIAGVGKPETLREVQGVAARLGIEKQLILPGWVDRRVLAWVIGQCAAGIVASNSETFGHAYIEPMALGKPVIGTRGGVASWLLMDYFTGIGFGYRDEQGLGRAFEYMVTHPEHAAQMGRNAAALVRPLFTWENVASSHFGIYQSLWMQPISS